MANNTETEVLNSINLIGYQGALLAKDEFKKALDEGPRNVEFTKLVSFLTNELRVLCNIEECVNEITAPEDATSFILEISFFLNKLGCAYPSLTEGNIASRLRSVEDRLLLVEHLVTELMAARILSKNRLEKKIEPKLKESSQVADLRKMLQTLGFPKPPPNITMKSVMQKLVPTVQNIVQKAHPDLIGHPAIYGTLSEEQWETLRGVQQELHGDYMIQRETLLKLLDCTIQSFQDSQKIKGKEEEFNKAYTEKRKLLMAEPDVDLSDLLASRDDVAVIEKTGNASVRKNTKSSINKVIMGEVPDRGRHLSKQAPELAINKVIMGEVPDRGRHLSKQAPELSINKVIMGEVPDRSRLLSKQAPEPWPQRALVVAGRGRGGGDSNYWRGGGIGARRKLF